MKSVFLLFCVFLLTTAFACTVQSFSDKRVSPPTVADMLQPKRLRILSYNIHHANPPGQPGLIDVAAVARVIRAAEPDLVALQEVDINTGRSGGIDQAKRLAELSGMQDYFFAKAIDHDGGEYGVAILTKSPMLDRQKFPLPDDPSLPAEPRVLATATVKTPEGHDFVFATTHLDHKNEANRLIQLKEIKRIAALNPLPMILVGDFNAQPGSPTIQSLDSLFQRTCNPCGPTFPQINPDRAIDFISFRPADRFTVVSHQIIQEPYASDHLPILSALELK